MAQVTKTINERGDITTNLSFCSIKKYYKKRYANKFGNLEKQTNS